MPTKTLDISLSNIRKLTKQQLLEYISQLEEALVEERKLHKEDNDIYENMIAETESKVQQLNMQVLELKGKLISKDITLNSYKDKVGNPIISEGEEKDKYPGEQKDFVLSLIEKHMKSVPVFTRAHSICKSLLEANPAVGYRRSIIDTILNTFKNRNFLDDRAVNTLKDIGICCRRTNTHWKLTFDGDDRYFVSVSGTPSDKRNFLNSASDLIFRLF